MDPSSIKIKDIVHFLIKEEIKERFFDWCGVRWYAEVETVEDMANLSTKVWALLVM